MATNASWTVIFDDKMVVKNNGAEAGTGYVINDNDFWGLAKWSNIWAIQYATSNVNDQVEYRDETPHSSYAEANLGDFQEFITRWDAAHLAKIQADWDADGPIVTHDLDGNVLSTETEEEKIARLGARPTSYSS
tara:strand:+ start:342 stop:743 length:402 start_codon:yes stop_codon:yes gene_type:complete